MSRTEDVANYRSAHRLIKLWSERYLPDLSSLPADKRQFPIAELVQCASPSGRARTVHRLQALLSIQSELPGLEANFLYSYIPNIVTLDQARRLAPSIKRVYDKVFELYQQQESPSTYLKYITVSRDVFRRLALPSLMLPMIEQLAEVLDPVLSELKASFLSAPDPRTFSFITTQFHFTTQDIYQKITPCETVLITPFLKFVEEQLCIPWQRVCAAAQRSPNAEQVVIVERLMPQTQDIANRVFEQSTRHFSRHSSRRGALNQSAVAASTVRDLTMVQGYFYLSVLENNPSAIERELLPLCLAVFPSVGVQWGLVEAIVRSLQQEMLSRLTPEQIGLLLPYAQALQDAFVDAYQPVKVSTRL